jgi:hypothetical protein
VGIVILTERGMAMPALSGFADGVTTQTIGNQHPEV